MNKVLGLIFGLLFSVATAEPLTFALQRLEAGETKNVTETSFKEKFLLIAVGYTGCPDICPTTMLDISSALKELDKSPQQVTQIQPLFVTIDPIADSLSDISRYAAFFDKRIIGLRAENFDDLNNLIRQLRADYGYMFEGKPVFPPNLPKGYTVMHSSYLYLYSPKGKLLDAYPYSIDGATLANEIRKQLQ